MECLKSEKKGEGTIFYKKPLKSQKGNVAKCLLESNSPRCPISHPEFEKFRALSFLNNIRYRLREDDEWQSLSKEQRKGLMQDKFMRTAVAFKFEEITKWLSDRLGVKLYNDKEHTGKTINYKGYTSVSGCPICARMKKILGENWETRVIESEEERLNKKTGKTHKKRYTYEDVWHICFDADEAEDVGRIATGKLRLDKNAAKEMVKLWGAIREGYSDLSLKAIRKINRMLEEGFGYDEAVMLAKVPEIVGEQWASDKQKVVDVIRTILDNCERERYAYQITNNLIAQFKDQYYGSEGTAKQLEDIDMSVFHLIKLYNDCKTLSA